MQAAIEAINAARDVPVEMKYFAADDITPEQQCDRQVADSDVYVGIIGFRYGTPVPDRPELSYTQMEFETATRRGLLRLIFLLDEHAEFQIPVSELFDRKYADRQDAFRTSLAQAGLTLVRVGSPDELERRLYQALVEPRPTPSPAVVEASQHDDFLDRVAEVCRVRLSGAQVTRVATGDTGQVHLRVTAPDPEGTGVRQLPVGASPGGVTRADLERFLAEVDAGYRVEDPQVTSWLVYGGDRAPDDLIRDARRRGVRVVSFLEYQGVVDLRGYVERTDRSLRQDPRYPPELYVTQRYTLLEGGDGAVQPDLLCDVLKWLEIPEARLVLVLGDFGIGKSFLTRELFHRIPRELPDLVPMLIQIGRLQRAGTLDELLALHLAGESVIELPKIRYMLQEGRIALLVDGYDELAQRVTYDRAAEHLRTLLEATEGRAKVVLTSRSQHFRSDQQVTTALGTRIEDLPGRRLVMLRELDEPQIQEFLSRFCHDEFTAAQRFELIRDARDLLGLSKNPRMLSFIAALEEERLVAVRNRSSGAISAAELYRELLGRWLEHEQERGDPRGGEPSLLLGQRWEAATRLALELWPRPEGGLRLPELEGAVATMVSRLPALRMDVDQAAHAVGSGTLLVRDEQGAFSFLHGSVLEWLVANAAAAEIAAGARSEALSQRRMSALMADFFVDLASKDVALAWARREAAEPAGDVSATNALLVLDRLDARPAEPAGLAGRNFRGMDLTGRSLERADLTGADLREATLMGGQLRGAVLREASLRGARLDRANLREADLRGADLTGARLLGVDLRGAVVDHGTWRRTALVGAHMDGEALDRLDSWGAARPETTRVETQLGGVDAGCTSVVFTPGGEVIVSGHLDGSLMVWEAESGRALRALVGHPGAVRSVAVSPDGRWLASAGDDGVVRRWETESGASLSGLGDHRDRLWAVAVSPDGSWLASAGDDGVVRRWEAESGRLLSAFRGHLGPVRSVAIGREGSWLVSAGDDAEIRIWEVATGLLLRRLTGHGGPVLDVAISPDGRWLASAGADWTVRLWEAETALGTRMLRDHVGPVTSVAVAPDGSWLASAGQDRVVRLWDAGGAARHSLEGHTAAVRGVAVSRDGSCIASAGDDGVVRLWEVEGGRPLHTTSRSSVRPLSSLAISADGRCVAAAGDDRVELWETGTGRRERVLTGELGLTRSVAVSPDGAWLAAAGADGVVTLGEPATGRWLRSLSGHTSSVWTVAISPDGTWLASAGHDRAVRLWQVETGQLLRVLTGHPSSVLALAISPDGTWLASAGADRVIRRWDARSGAALGTLGGLYHPVQSVAISPDGTRLASAGDDRMVRVWQVGTGQQLHVLEGHTGPVRSVAFSPDGTWLASAGDDRVVRRWDVAGGRPLGVLRGHAGPVRGIAVGPGGSWLASAGDDGVVRLWDAVGGGPIATLVSLPEGWACLLPDGGYKLEGVAAGAFWHVAGLCRFEPGELDQYLPSLHRLPVEAVITPAWSGAGRGAAGA